MIGQTILHYKILEKLGEGGMGVVYKAQDTKLDRFVALKFLPSHLSASEQDKARFIQEAKAASALNHPNVCTVHDILEQDGQLFIVMEYVNGQTLREKNQNLSIKQVVDIGVQIADGLATAHEHGIVHRDIKPENIMVRKDGIVQVMDFGLAKLRGVTKLTKEGSTIGTIGYMSPEQVQGLEMDHRTDIFSLGVVLYELLGGQLPFKGIHETAIMYEIVNVDAAPISSIRPEVDASLDSIILECLAKEPDERYQSAKEVSKELKRFKRESSKLRVSRITAARPVYQPTEIIPQQSGPEGSIVEKIVNRIRKDTLAWTVAGIFVLLTVLFSLAYIIQPNARGYTIRSYILPPEKTNFYFYGGEAGPVVISPDGKQIAFVANSAEGKRFLYVQPLGAQKAQLLIGTENASYPFWSPDNRFIGFFADGKLKKVEASGSPPFAICDAPTARGGTWNDAGIILFSPTAGDGIYKVSVDGGTVTDVTKLDSIRKEQTHRWPYFLPDGKHFLYHARTAVTGSEKENDAIYVASLDLKVNKILVNASSNMAYASGYLLFMRGSTLVAQKFDEKNLELKGDVIPVAEGVLNDAGFNLAVFSVSKNGVLVYQIGTALAGSKLIIYDRTGKPLRTVGEVTEFFTPHFSPDGKKVAVGTFDAKSRNQDIWMYDIERGIRTRFTFDLAVEFDPIWSPDGKRIVFNSTRKGIYDLYEKPSSGDKTESLLYESHEPKFPTDWSLDGKFIIFTSQGKNTRADLWILPYMSENEHGDHKPFPLLQTEFNEVDGHFSPDGKWIAYTSDESGQAEVYVRPFPGLGGKWQISTDGGEFPRWRRDGKELYFMNRSEKLFAAEVHLEGSTVTIGKINPLFDTRPIMNRSVYDVIGDGFKFLINTRIDPESSAPITLVVNWDLGMEKK